MTTLTKRQGVIGKWLAAAVVAALVIGLWRPLTVVLSQAVIAALLAGIVLPLCRILERHLPGGWAAGLSMLALMLGLSIVLLLLVPQLIIQARLIISKLPALIQGAQDLLRRAQESEWFNSLSLTAARPEQFLQQAAVWVTDRLPDMLPLASQLVDSLSRVFLAPVLAFYFLRDREMFLFRLSLLIPVKHRKETLKTLKAMRREAMYFVRGQLLIALCVFVLTALGLLIVGLPAWLALGLIMGFCELIPYVGPIIGAIPIALFALPTSLSTCFWSLMVAFLVQQIEGTLISPRVMGGATGLHPAWVLLLLTFGGLAAGLKGMVLTLPIFLALRACLRVLTETNPRMLDALKARVRGGPQP